MEEESIFVDLYIKSFPEPIAKKLEEMRDIITETIPMSKEIFSYKMPAYKVNKILVYFGGFKNHISLFPTSSGIIAFEKELELYKHSKGAIQFPINKPLPKDLIERIIEFRLEEDRG